MTKKMSSEIFAPKMGIFSEKNLILVREKVFRPPKLGARFPPLGLHEASVERIDAVVVGRLEANFNIAVMKTN